MTTWIAVLLVAGVVILMAWMVGLCRAARPSEHLGVRPRLCSTCRSSTACTRWRPGTVLVDSEQHLALRCPVCRTWYDQQSGERLPEAAVTCAQPDSRGWQ
jgi:hypothetical protein